MHIAFDISQTGTGKAGCGYYAHALIQFILELTPRKNSYSLLPSFGSFYFDSSMPLLNPYSGKNIKYGPRHLSLGSARKFWTKPNIETLLGKPDVIHANNFWCPTQLSSSRLVYTLYDLGFLENPSWTSEANRVGCFEGVFRASIKADWIVSISEFTRNHFLSFFSWFPSDRIRVIYPCSRFTDSNSEGVRPPKSERLFPEKFWLSVGTIEPRKGYDTLVDAYARYLSLGGDTLPLVIAGGKGWLMDDFQKRIENLGIANHVIMLGYVSDKNLIWLYRHCFANLYPSLFEGFGLPILEGMQFGAPTLASNSSSIPEVVGDSAIMIAPGNTEIWAQTMVRLIKDKSLRTRLSEASRVRAQSFSWKNSAFSLLSLYDEAVLSPKRTSSL